MTGADPGGCIPTPCGNPVFGTPGGCCKPSSCGCESQECGCNQAWTQKHLEPKQFAGNCGQPCTGQEWVCSPGGAVGTYRNALDRATDASGLLGKVAGPMFNTIQGAGSCGSNSGCGAPGCATDGTLVNVVFGNLMTQIKHPAGGPTDPNIILTYNSRDSSTQASIFGWGWTGTSLRKLSVVTITAADITTGDGAVAHYDQKNASGVFRTPNGWNNKLVENPDGSFTESQPDFSSFSYNSTGQMTSMVSPAGLRWTYSYDGSNRVSSIESPANRRTTYNYQLILSPLATDIVTCP